MSSSRWLEDHVFPMLRAGHRVLIVEGEEDQKVYETWLDKSAGGAGTPHVPVVVVAGGEAKAGGKTKVLQYLKSLRDKAEAGRVHGIVDRDEWGQTEIDEQTAGLPGLLVNRDRHCLESYFCDPINLRAALFASPLLEHLRSAKAIKALEKAVKAGLADWVDHWSLWTTMEQLKNRMSEAAYPAAFHQGITPPTNRTIKAKLKEWAAMINVDQILEDYRDLRKEARDRPERERLRSCIYAKNVFPQVVLVELNKLTTEIESNGCNRRFYTQSAVFFTIPGWFLRN